jgi:hypothetical protein
MGHTTCVGRVLGLLESFPFFQDGRRPWALVGPVCVTHVFHFSSGISPPIRVSLIVVPDSSPLGFGRVSGFGQRVFLRFPPLRDRSGLCIRQAHLGASPADVTTPRSG